MRTHCVQGELTSVRSVYCVEDEAQYHRRYSIRNSGMIPCQYIHITIRQNRALFCSIPVWFSFWNEPKIASKLTMSSFCGTFVVSLRQFLWIGSKYSEWLNPTDCLPMLGGHSEKMRTEMKFTSFRVERAQIIFNCSDKSSQKTKSPQPIPTSSIGKHLSQPIK